MKQPELKDTTVLQTDTSMGLFYCGRNHRLLQYSSSLGALGTNAQRKGSGALSQNKIKEWEQGTTTYAASESMILALDGSNRASPGAGSSLKAQRMAATKM